MQPPRFMCATVAAVGFACLSAALTSTAASASTLVIGQSNAAACYQNALSQNTSRRAINGCDAALDADTLTRRDRAATHINRGILRHYRDDEDGALDDFQAALNLRPSMGEAYSNLALIYARRQQWSEAVEALDHGIALAPSLLHRSYFSRGVAREELGDLAGAYADFSQAAQLAPDWAAPQRELERFTVRMESADDS